MTRDNLFNGYLVQKTYGLVFKATKATTLECVIATNDSDSGAFLHIDLKETDSGSLDKSSSIISNYNIVPYETILVAQLIGFTIKPGWSIWAKTNNDIGLSLRGSGIIS